MLDIIPKMINLIPMIHPCVFIMRIASYPKPDLFTMVGFRSGELTSVIQM